MCTYHWKLSKTFPKKKNKKSKKEFIKFILNPDQNKAKLKIIKNALPTSVQCEVIQTIDVSKNS